MATLNEATDISSLEKILGSYDPYKPNFYGWQQQMNDINARLTGGGKVGSQTLAGVTGDPIAMAQQAAQEAAMRLKEIDPYFDPKNFMMDTVSKLAERVGGGSDANKKFAMASPYMRAYDILQSIKKAEQAAQEYERTGKVMSTEEAYQNEWRKITGGGDSLTYTAGGDSPANPSYTVTQSFEDYLSGVGVPEQAKEAANAAAVRAGTDLPFAGSAIGELSEGGRFRTTEEAQQYYDESGKFMAEQYQADRGEIMAGQQQQQQIQENPWGRKIREAIEGGINPNTGVPLTDAQMENLKKQYLSATGNEYTERPTGQVGVTGQEGMAGQAGVAGQAGTTGQAGVAGTAGTTGAMAGGADLQGALDYINNSDLDEGTKSLFREVIRNWNPDSEININNVLKEFENIKNTTISPHFQEQSKIFIDSLKRNQEYMEGERGRELEAEEMAAGQRIESAQQALGRSGMWRTGLSGELLGGQGTYATEAGKGVLPVEKFGEGKVQAQSRLVASGSAARYQKNLEELQRQAETTLGSVQAQGLIPGVPQLGGITGTLPKQEKQAQAGALTGLYQQELQNVQAREPLKVF